MLTISVSAEAGCNLRDAMIEMRDLAYLVQVGVELKANDKVFWVYPDDTDDELHETFDRLFMTDSRYVSTRTPTPKPKSGRPPPRFPGGVDMRALHKAQDAAEGTSGTSRDAMLIDAYLRLTRGESVPDKWGSGIREIGEMVKRNQLDVGKGAPRW